MQLIMFLLSHSLFSSLVVFILQLQSQFPLGLNILHKSLSRLLLTSNSYILSHITIILLLILWCNRWHVVSKSSPAVNFGFLDRSYRYRSVATQISQDSVSPILYPGPKFIPYRRSTSDASRSTSSKQYTKTLGHEVETIIV